MERFKVLERETKTKAYSKDGLNNAAAGGSRARRNKLGGGGGDDGEGGDNEQYVDPREDPDKKELFTMLDTSLEKLQAQISEMDEKQESIRASGKKKKNSAADTTLLEELSHKVDRHNYHMDQLRIIIDRLENDELEVKLVEDIQDSPQLLHRLESRGGLPGGRDHIRGARARQGCGGKMQPMMMWQMAMRLRPIKMQRARRWRMRSPRRTRITPPRPPAPSVPY